MSETPHPHSSLFRRGQGTMEYLLVMVAVLLAVLFAVRAGGPVQAAVGTVLSDASGVIEGMAIKVSQRF